MEILAKLHSAVFDKTGTLTTGHLTVTEVHSLDENLSEEELLHLCAVGESFSSHPMAQAVVEHYGKPDSSAVRDYQEISGMGVRFSLEEKAYLCGGTRLLNANGIGTASLPEATEIAQSASFIAKISFTPSPVIATVLPACLIERIKSAFCSGVTRPNTVY